MSSLGWNAFIDERKNLRMLVSFILNKCCFDKQSKATTAFQRRFCRKTSVKAPGSCQDLTVRDGVFVYVKCLLGGASWSKFLTLKMFLLITYSKENKKEKIVPPPLTGLYKIPAAVKLKGKFVPLARVVIRNSKNTVAR